MHRLLALALSVLPCLAACLENEEEIEVLADGSVRVTARIHGDPADLAGGYNLSLTAPWAPTDAGARVWLAKLGAETGGAALLERCAGADWAGWFGGKPEEEGLTLTAQAEFASVADWPRFHAPATEPYGDAYLERSASLTVDDKGDRLVYTFERVYHARPWAGFDASDRLESAFEPALQAKLDALEPLTPDEIAEAAAIGRAEYRVLFDALAGVALDVAYTRGSAGLPPAAAQRARGALADYADELLSERALAELWSRITAWAADLKSGVVSDGPNPFEQLDIDMRDGLREALARSLAADRVPESAGNELRFGLEWALTQYDHSLDLADEEFHVTVRMPGTIVAGTYDELADGAASFGFEFIDLADRDVVLRAVSVLPK